MLQQKQTQYFKNRLMEEKNHLKERIRSMDQGGLGDPMGWSISELSLYDNHPADVGSEVFERAKDFALREDAAETLQAVEDALHRIDRGTYGACDVCGAEIPLERLEAVPYSTLCLRCKKGDEQIPRTQDRPVEEEIMEEIYEHGLAEDNNMYDWEDAWQDIARGSEHAPFAEAGAYYGTNELEEESRGSIEDVDDIPYEIGDDGVIYESFRSFDDEGSPREKIDVGFDHQEGVQETHRPPM